MTEVVPTCSMGLPIVYQPGDPLADNGTDSIGGRPPKAAEATAELIVRGIVEKGYQVGDRMPPESEMLARLGVSRETLREALRILEAQGILRIRRGPGGGPFVNALNASYLARTAALYFHLSGATYEELFESWAIIEPLMSAKVAANPDRRWKLNLLEPFKEYDPNEHTRGEMISDLNHFHGTIATMSGNRVLTLLTQAIDHIVVHHIMKRIDPQEKGIKMAHSHNEIANAIIDGYPTKARKLMEQHIRDVVEWTRVQHPEIIKELIEWR